MPRVDGDPVLQARAEAFGAKLGYAAAARFLEVDRLTFYRFCRTGKTVRGTRERIRAGLDQVASRTVGGTPPNLMSPPINEMSPLEMQLASADLRQVRQFCESVLKLLDSLELRRQAPHGADVANGSETQAQQPAGG